MREWLGRSLISLRRSPATVQSNRIFPARKSAYQNCEFRPRSAVATVGASSPMSSEDY